MSGFPLLFLVPRSAVGITIVMINYSNNYLRIQYKVNGKVMIHDAAALHRLDFHIRVPHSKPIPVTLNVFQPEPDGRGTPQELDEPHASVDGEDTPRWISICCTSIILLCTIRIPFGLQDFHVIPISPLSSGFQCCCVVPFCEGPIGGGESCVIAPNGVHRVHTVHPFPHSVDCGVARFGEVAV